MSGKMKRIVTNLAIAVMIALMMPGQTLTAFAANGRIAFSDRAAAVGGEVSINMKITSNGGDLKSADVMLAYDASLLEFVSGTDASGGAGSVRVKVGADAAGTTSFSSALTFKALQAGTTKITVSNQEIYDTADQLVTIDKQGDSTVSITGAANASKDASLSELKISPGTLTPGFSPEVEQYTATVGVDVDKLTINALAAGTNARVAVSGSEGLQMGENQIICKVTAEDGQTERNYTIQVTKTEDAVSEGTETEIPEDAVKVITAEKTVTIIPLEEGVEIPNGFAECTIKIDGRDIQGWIWASDTDYKYCVFYGVNEGGEKDFYRYDLKEKTMQRYFMDPTAKSEISMDQYIQVAEEYNALTHDYNVRLGIIIVLIILSVVLLIIIAILMVKRNKGNDEDSYRYDDIGIKEMPVVRPKTARSITKEERYMRGLEEDEAKETDNLDSVEQERVVQTKEASKPRTSKAVEDDEDDDDDFEFIDLDL